MKKTIIVLACQNLNDYEQHNSPAFWETIEGYYKDGWEIHIINAFEKSMEDIDRGKYRYTEFAIPFAKTGAIRKIGWFFRIFRHNKMQGIYKKHMQRILKESKDKNCLIYCYEIWTVSAGKKISQKYELPLVTRFQGTSMYDKQISIKNRLRYFPHFGALQTKADLVLMTNDGTKGEEFLRRIENKTEKILFLRNGVDVANEVTTDLPFVAELKPGEKVLMTLSRLAYWKRIDRAIIALAEVVKKYPECKLVIVGYGDEKDNLERLACEMGVREHIIFTGEVAHDLVFSYISRTDIFLSLYDMSNLGNPLMEAMRCGKPIITLDVGDTNKVIKNDVNGILLSVDETDLIPDRIIKLFENKEYAQKLAAGAKNFATENFLTWEERINKELTEVNKLMIEKRN